MIGTRAAKDNYLLTQPSGLTVAIDPASLTVAGLPVAEWLL